MTERDRRREQIARFRHIADLSAWREQLAHHVGSPLSWSARQRARQLRPFLPFFQRVLHPHSPFDRLRHLACNLQLARRWGWPLHLFRQPSVRAETGETLPPPDLLEPIFAALFAEPAALSAWMQEVDAQTQAASTQFLERIDHVAREQRGPLTTDIVLVGGGPLTSVLSCLLAPFFAVTVVTDETVLGASWRYRPLFLNSSANVNDSAAPALPLLGGPTTRLSDSLQLGNLEISLLLDAETKRVLCNDGSRLDYPSGKRFGELVATNIVLNADHVLLHQQVDVEQVQRLTNGRLQLSLRDTRDDIRRSLRASAVFLLTGPGQECSRLSDALSQALYQQSLHQVTTTVSTLRTHLGWYQDALPRLLSAQHVPGVGKQCRWIQEHIQVACRQIDLPPLLTLGLVESLYAFWQQECGGDPACFPFTKLFALNRSLAVVGNGDTGRTLKEWIDGCGPQSAYPVGIQPTQRPSVTLYNEQATSAQAYATANRRRYQDVWSPHTRAITQKARQYRRLPMNTRASRVEVTHVDAAGKRHRYRFETVFDATGLAPASLADQLPAALGEVHMIRDLAGQVVARGNEASHLYLVGAAANLRFEDLPDDLQRIVEILQIKENRLALWLNGVLAERLGLSYLLSHAPTKSLGKEKR